MIDKIEKFREYLDYIERHYLNVQKAWELIQDKCQNENFSFLNDEVVFSAIQLDVTNHDLSKLSAEEFTQYRQWFFPAEGETKDKAQFDSAWAHHKANNIHHWQNWTQIPPTPHDDAYVVAMLVDWIAMSFEFGDTAKNYYEQNSEYIELPEWAVKLMYKIFDCIY